jgi:hypothetical protein
LVETEYVGKFWMACERPIAVSSDFEIHEEFEHSMEWVRRGMPLWVAVFKRLDLEFEVGERIAEGCPFTEVFAKFKSSDECIS